LRLEYWRVLIVIQLITGEWLEHGGPQNEHIKRGIEKNVWEMTAGSKTVACCEREKKVEKGKEN